MYGHPCEVKLFMPHSVTGGGTTALFSLLCVVSKYITGFAVQCDCCRYHVFFITNSCWAFRQDSLFIMSNQYEMSSVHAHKLKAMQ